MNSPKFAKVTKAQVIAIIGDKTSEVKRLTDLLSAVKTDDELNARLPEVQGVDPKHMAKVTIQQVTGHVEMLRTDCLKLQHAIDKTSNDEDLSSLIQQIREADTEKELEATEDPSSRLAEGQTSKSAKAVSEPVSITQNPKGAVLERTLDIQHAGAPIVEPTEKPGAPQAPLGPVQSEASPDGGAPHAESDALTQ